MSDVLAEAIELCQAYTKTREQGRFRERPGPGAALHQPTAEACQLITHLPSGCALVEDVH